MERKILLVALILLLGLIAFDQKDLTIFISGIAGMLFGYTRK